MRPQPPLTGAREVAWEEGRTLQKQGCTSSRNGINTGALPPGVVGKGNNYPKMHCLRLGGQSRCTPTGSHRELRKWRRLASLLLFPTGFLFGILAWKRPLSVADGLGGHDKEGGTLSPINRAGIITTFHRSRYMLFSFFVSTTNAKLGYVLFRGEGKRPHPAITDKTW